LSRFALYFGFDRKLLLSAGRMDLYSVMSNAVNNTTNETKGNDMSNDYDTPKNINEYLFAECVSDALGEEFSIELHYGYITVTGPTNPTTIIEDVKSSIV